MAAPPRAPFATTLVGTVLDQLLGRAWSRGWVPWVVAGAGAAGAAIALALGHPIGIPCPFRLLTGLPCPACGLTHAMLALGRGDLAGSWQAHPGGMLLGAGVVVAAIDAAVWAIRGRGWWPTAGWSRGPVWAIAVGAILAAVTALRWAGVLAWPPPV